MKKPFYLLVTAGLFMFTFASCDSREENRTEAMEDAADDMEDAVEDDDTIVVQ
jgi:hypothetical protein